LRRPDYSSPNPNIGDEAGFFVFLL